MALKTFRYEFNNPLMSLYRSRVLIFNMYIPKNYYSYIYRYGELIKPIRNSSAIYEDLCKKIMDKEGEISDEAKDCCFKLANIFENQKILDFVVEYGGEDKAISLDIKLNNEIEFLITTEAEDNDGTLNFSIIRNGEVLFMNYDKLDDFKQNINNFFCKFEGLEDQKEKSQNYPILDYKCIYDFGEIASKSIDFKQNINHYLREFERLEVQGKWMEMYPFMGYKHVDFDEIGEVPYKYFGL